MGRAKKIRPQVIKTQVISMSDVLGVAWNRGLKRLEYRQDIDGSGVEEDESEGRPSNKASASERGDGWERIGSIKWKTSPLRKKYYLSKHIEWHKEELKWLSSTSIKEGKDGRVRKSLNRRLRQTQDYMTPVRVKILRIGTLKERKKVA